MFRRTLLLIAVLGTTLLPAQEKHKLTLTDAILKGREYYPEQVQALQWIKGTSNYCFIKDNQLVQGSLKGKDAVLATVEDLSRGLATGDSVKRFPRVEWTDAKTFLFQLGARTYAYDAASKTSALRFTLPADAENEDHDEAYRHVAFTRGENLFIAGPNDSITQVTFDGTDGIVNGKSVHREEYGITKGTFSSTGCSPSRAAAMTRPDPSGARTAASSPSTAWMKQW
mgnify:CR=1 FL=1